MKIQSRASSVNTASLPPEPCIQCEHSQSPSSPHLLPTQTQTLQADEEFTQATGEPLSETVNSQLKWQRAHNTVSHSLLPCRVSENNQHHLASHILALKGSRPWKITLTVFSNTDTHLCTTSAPSNHYI